MKRTFFSILVMYGLAAAVYGVGEKSLLIGAGAGWEAMVTRSGVLELGLARPHPVLALSSAESAMPSPEADLRLSFDEQRKEDFADSCGKWLVISSSGVKAVSSPWDRRGGGAARFEGLAGNAGEGPLVVIPGRDALFAAQNRVGSFTLEFWLYPLNLESGEKILNWTSSTPGGQGNYLVRGIMCMVSKNTLRWDFVDFFESPSGGESMSLTLTGPALTPKSWSHHLIRFDGQTGLLEYLVDGNLSALDYAARGGREGGEVFTPLMGGGGSFVIAGRFSGLIDEFNISGDTHDVTAAALVKYRKGGRAETRTLDLGDASARVLRIEAGGGWTRGGAKSFYAGKNQCRFDDYSELALYVRAGSTPYNWDGIPWVKVTPGTELDESVKGRFIQAAVDFFPSGDGETSPYLDELCIVYRTGGPIDPPSWVSAAAKDGEVEISWRETPSKELGGYLVYFGASGGEYLGSYAIVNGKRVVSPIDAGYLTSVKIEGLENGILYYFAVASYDKNVREPGEFSRETAARPVRMNK
jgi:hypothetical protein